MKKLFLVVVLSVGFFLSASADSEMKGETTTTSSRVYDSYTSSRFDLKDKSMKCGSQKYSKEREKQTPKQLTPKCGSVKIDTH